MEMESETDREQRGIEIERQSVDRGRPDRE